ncbi:hypothetical protein C8R45DRAFT_931180 [Mycena sanguinolenta]|nr:hypothetical protein C8R45DRAFT_931180 [Mycena sanguinolenta]
MPHSNTPYLKGNRQELSEILPKYICKDQNKFLIGALSSANSLIDIVVSMGGFKELPRSQDPRIQNNINDTNVFVINPFRCPISPSNPLFLGIQFVTFFPSSPSHPSLDKKCGFLRRYLEEETSSSGGPHPNPVRTRSDRSSYGTRSPVNSILNFVAQVLCICAEHTFTDRSASAEGFGPAIVTALDAYLGSPTEAEVINDIEMDLEAADDSEADHAARIKKLSKIIKAHPLRLKLDFPLRRHERKTPQGKKSVQLPVNPAHAHAHLAFRYLDVSAAKSRSGSSSARCDRVSVFSAPSSLDSESPNAWQHESRTYARGIRVGERGDAGMISKRMHSGTGLYCAPRRRLSDCDPLRTVTLGWRWNGWCGDEEITSGGGRNHAPLQ